MVRVRLRGDCIVSDARLIWIEGCVEGWEVVARGGWSRRTVRGI